MRDTKIDPVDPGLGKPAEDVLEDRPVANGDEGLGQHGGVGTQSQSESPSKHDGSHTAYSSGRKRPRPLRTQPIVCSMPSRRPTWARHPSSSWASDGSDTSRRTSLSG